VLKSQTTKSFEDPDSQAIWQLVLRTRAHPDYQRLYSLPSWSKGWVRTNRLGDGGTPPASSPLRLVGLDCEMCATERDSSALLGLAAVDAKGDVLLKVCGLCTPLQTDQRRCKHPLLCSQCRLCTSPCLAGLVVAPCMGHLVHQQAMLTPDDVCVNCLRYAGAGALSDESVAQVLCGSMCAGGHQ